MPKNDSSLYLNCIHIIYPPSSQDFFWGPGVRDCYVIHYIRKGSGYFESGGKKYHLSRGDSFLITPGTLINYYPDPRDPWVYTWVDFSGLEAKQLLKHCSLSAKNPVTKYKCPELENIFKSAAANVKRESFADVCRNDAMLRYIISEYIRLYPAESEKIETETITARAAEYIENNYRHPELNLDEISLHLGINRATLHRKFVNELGVSPGNYITQLRIQKACALLGSSNFPIKFISYSTGFANQLYFAKVFKKQMGVTPTEYRIKNREAV